MRRKDEAQSELRIGAIEGPSLAVWLWTRSALLHRPRFPRRPFFSIEPGSGTVLGTHHDAPLSRFIARPCPAGTSRIFRITSGRRSNPDEHYRDNHFRTLRKAPAQA